MGDKGQTQTADKALTGKSFAVNPNPTGWWSDGTCCDEIKPEEKAARDDDHEAVEKGTE